MIPHDFRLLASWECQHECCQPLRGRHPMCHLWGPCHRKALWSLQLWRMQGVLQTQRTQKPHVFLQVRIKHTSLAKLCKYNQNSTFKIKFRSSVSNVKVNLLLPNASIQIQQTVHCGQRQEKSVSVLQTKEMFSSWDEEGRYMLKFHQLILLKK